MTPGGVALAAVLAVAASDAPQAPVSQLGMASRLDGFPGFVERSMARWAVPGLAVAVLAADQVVLMRGFGYRDVERRLPVTPKTLFGIGSCTKAFTATALGILADEGRIDLDTPVVEYLPDFRLFDDYATRHATPRDLLTHRTGLPAYDSLWLLRSPSRLEILEDLRYLEPSAKLRETFQYSNLVYVVAGFLAGRVSGGTWEELVQTRIFGPLGMGDSNFSVEAMRRSEDFALPYGEIEGEPVEIAFRNMDAMGPASSINSNLADMVKWLRLQLEDDDLEGNRVVSATRLREIHSPQMTITDPDVIRLTQASRYGQGWYLSSYKGHTVIEHPGGVEGFTANVSLMPSRRVGVVVLTNKTANLLVNVVTREVYDRLLGLPRTDWNPHFEGLIEEYLAGMRPVSPETVAGAEARHPLPAYTGCYEHPAYGRIRVGLDGSRLQAELFGFQASLEPLSDCSFLMTDSPLGGRRARFGLDEGGRGSSLSLPLDPGGPYISFRRQRCNARAGVGADDRPPPGEAKP